LKFGEFKLKSGRISPYFFNLGLISSGYALRELGSAYAQALAASGVACDMLFGPAYKGIPLVAAVSIALAEGGRDLPYAYNRKEAKDHGEGGLIVGPKPSGRVVIIDDVLTAGTALRESIKLLRDVGANPVAALIALDRQEQGPGGRSAVAEMEREQNLRMIALVNVREMLEFLDRERLPVATLESIRKYQAQYGVQA
ncbi:MAG TPA: orotate phosphoribosyltransferase, partial [Verrucomicrobiae bacterium]|nr:orotate phosphoribosyltransferase [Verrucomicrobiae bacterium]